jgi:perosamine synthetase
MGQQLIDEQDIETVVSILCSDWLTTGPKVREFEQAMAETTGACHSSSNTSKNPNFDWRI